MELVIAWGGTDANDDGERGVVQHNMLEWRHYGIVAACNECHSSSTIMGVHIHLSVGEICENLAVEYLTALNMVSP